MPELGPKDSSFIRKMKDNMKIFSGLLLPNGRDIAALVETYNEEYIGKGKEVVVIALKGSTEPTKVVAFNYRDVSPERAKEIFYLHRLFSILFPHNFPHFYASSGQDPKSRNENVSGTVRQRIEFAEANSIGGQTKSETRPYPFKKVEEFCRELHIPIAIDYVGKNLFLGVDGGEYYVDTLNRYPGMLDSYEIIKYMKKEKYSEDDIKIAKLTIERLNALNKRNK